MNLLWRVRSITNHFFDQLRRVNSHSRTCQRQSFFQEESLGLAAIFGACFVLALVLGLIASTQRRDVDTSGAVPSQTPEVKYSKSLPSSQTNSLGKPVRVITNWGKIWCMTWHRNTTVICLIKPVLWRSLEPNGIVPQFCTLPVHTGCAEFSSGIENIVQPQTLHEKGKMKARQA